MEIAGGTKIFSSPEGKHGLYYTSFYGDGDSKAYPAVKGIYGQSKPIKKFKCVGNCQKSLISRLRNLKKINTVGLGRKEKLTKIDTVENYFGIALRSKVGNLVAMKSARMAWMYHICGYQDTSPKSEDTWCQYQNDKQDNTNYYKSKDD